MSNNAYFKGLKQRCHLYIYPWILVFLEIIYRLQCHLKLPFMGPILASAGLGLILPLTIPKKRDFGISKSFKEEVEKKGVKLGLDREEIFIRNVWLFLVFNTAIWMVSLELSLNVKSKDYWWSFFLGVFTYFSCVALSEIGEVV